MKFLFLFISFGFIHFSHSQKIKPILYIVFEKTFESSEDLKKEYLSLGLKNSVVKKYLTKLIYGGARKIDDADLKKIGIDLVHETSFCQLCNTIENWNINPETSFQTNVSLNSCKLFTGISKGPDLNEKLKNILKEKSKENLKVLLYEAQDRAKITLTDVPTELTKSNICKFSIDLNTNTITSAKIYIENLDKNNLWEGGEKKEIQLFKGQNKQEIEFESSGRICVEFQISNDSKCLSIERSGIIKYNYKNQIKPIKLIHEGTQSSYNIETNEINIWKNDDYSKDDFCGAEYYIMPESDGKYYFYIEKQIGIDSIKMKMKDLCTNSNLKECNNEILYLTKDLGYKAETLDRFIIDVEKFDPGEANMLTCDDFFNYHKSINEQPDREWEITMTPILNGNAEFQTTTFSTCKIIFKKCGR